MARIKNVEMEMSNYKDFKTSIQKYGFSISNFYDIVFDISAGPLADRISRHPRLKVLEAKELMRLYTDEATLPGIQMSTGEYRITNSPGLKYAYGSVFSEVNFSFILDADSIIKSVFDIWTQMMYSYTENVNASNDLISNDNIHKFRTAYRDDYAVDITIIKYERGMSSDSNSKNVSTFPIKHIIPDAPKSNKSRFLKAIPVYAVRLFNAFPTNISSVTLNSGTSELGKLSTSFEYESYSTTALSGNNYRNFKDSVNGGISNFDIEEFLPFDFDFAL